jgi:peroxiredoxin Q/BCP
LSVPIGSPIPAFRAASTGGEIDSAHLKGRKLVLYFYPKDNTPGCTRQGADFRDRHDAFAQAGAVVLGVSRDSLKSHASFKSKLQFPFELVSDADEALCRAFDVLREKMLYGRKVRGIERSTFVFDAHGRLVREWRGVRVPGHVDEVLEVVRSL